MKKCPGCKTKLSLLGLRYKKKLNQYLCTKCNLIYLESAMGLITKKPIKQIEKLINNKKFENLLDRLGEFDDIN